MTDRIAIIVGNGTSRSEFDLNSLVDSCLDQDTFLCGIAYVDLDEDKQDRFRGWHVTVEDYRREMLLEGGIEKSQILYPQTSEQHFESSMLHGGGTRPRNNSGMWAMENAIRRGYNKIYVLGFDSLISDDPNQSISNMYEGKPETRAHARDNPNRVRYLDWFAQHNMFVNFTFVYDKEYEFFNVAAENIRVISYDTFEKEVFDYV